MFMLIFSDVSVPSLNSFYTCGKDTFSVLQVVILLRENSLWCSGGYSFLSSQTYSTLGGFQDRRESALYFLPL